VGQAGATIKTMDRERGWVEEEGGGRKWGGGVGGREEGYEEVQAGATSGRVRATPQRC